MKYKIFEHNRTKKFLKKHQYNKKLILEIYDTYQNIIENPYNSKYKELKSIKCPKCRRARVSKFRIIFYISEVHGRIEIIDIIPRKENYRLY